MDSDGKRTKEPITTLKPSTGDEIPSRRFARRMSNYCSIGIDARIGLGFDKSRSKNRIINKIVYAWEGLKKFLKPSVSISTVIDKMENLVEYEEVEELEKPPVETQTVKASTVGTSDVPPPPLQPEHINRRAQHSKSRKVSQFVQNDPSLESRVINGFKVYTRPVFQTSKPDKVLTINPINLIALNIPSYMGGIKNMWDKSDVNVPIKAGSEKIKIDRKQDMGDGILEFLSFTGNLRFGVLERLLTGGGKRVAQGTGPFLISFKQSSDPVLKPLVTYAQVDGEYMQLVNPLFLKFTLTPDLPNGKINGLVMPLK